MNTTRTKVMVVLAAIFMFGSSFAASSARGEGPGHGGKHGRHGHDPFFSMMHKLDLTDAQKAQVAAIIKPQEANIKTVVTEMAKARIQLGKDILSGSGDVSAAAANLATYEQQFAQLRATIFSQILAILNPDQKAMIQKRVDKMGTHVDQMIESRFAHLDKWLAKHGQ